MKGGTRECLSEPGYKSMVEEFEYPGKKYAYPVSVLSMHIRGTSTRYPGYEVSGVRGYLGYEDIWGTRVSGVRGNIRGTRVSGVRGYPGYEGIRVRGYPGYEGIQGTRVSRVRGHPGYEGRMNIRGMLITA